MEKLLEEQFARLKILEDQLKEALQKAETARQESEVVKAALQESEAARQKSETKMENVVIKKIFEKGLPGCVMALTSASTSCTTNEHQAVTFCLSEFVIVNNVENFSNCDSFSNIMCSASNGPLQFSSESDIQGLVKLVIKDMIEAAGLSNKITLLNELTFIRLRPDIWVLEFGETTKIPIASVELKREDKDLNNVYYLGQIFDYLLQLRQMHGRRDVFGIITNYFRWRIVWLPDCDSVARHPDEDITSVSLTLTSGCTVPRNLFGTSEISYDDLALPRYLVSLIRKLSHSKSIPRQILDIEKAYIEISPSLYHWVSSDLTKLTLKFPHGNVNKFLLLRDFKYGCNGRVWLACSSSLGNLCVIKFLRESAYGKGTVEAENWGSLYGVQASSIKMVKDCPAVIMPFAFQCKVIAGTRRFESCLSQESFPNDQDYLEEDVSAVNELDAEKIARQAIETIVSKGYIHDDVKWEHVAALPTVQENGSVTFTGVLIDLTRVTKLGSEVSQDTARTQMLCSLGLSV
eukprot:gene34955-45237_t